MNPHVDHDPATSADEDPRVLAAVKEYQAAIEAGRRPDRRQFLARHREIAAALGPYLDGLDLLHRGAKDLTGSYPPPARLDTGLGPGARLGEFEIVREVGRGGMGVVYEASQPALNRRVALKVLPGALAADAHRLRRFELEAQAAAAAAHPNIIPVYAVGEDRGVNFYAMRLVDGSPLDSLAAGIAMLRRDPPDPEPRPVGLQADGRTVPSAGTLVDLARWDRPAFFRAIARLGEHVARALDHAHQAGVIHRDVKPANLMLGRDGHVWVMDFGLAQFTEGGAGVTRSGATLGTLRYMSPEQAAGDRRRLDHRTDVYSLAATLYELLTGRPAFPTEDPAVLLVQIATDDPPAPRSIDPAIPRDLETVLLKALQKDPRDRYATAADLADDLARFVADEPVRARRPGLWDRAKRWAGRHPTGIAAALLVMVVVVAGFAVTTALVAGEQRETRKAYDAAAANARAERQRADEAERRYRQAKELSDLVLRISEEEIGSDSPLQAPRRRLLLAALANYRQLLAEGNDPAIRAELDRAERLLDEQTIAREAEAVVMLGNPDVRAELGLTPEQTDRIERLAAQKAPPGRGPRFGPPGFRDDPWRGLFDPAVRREVIPLLSETQRHRLRQVFLQFRGPMAFGEPDVVEALDLKPEQRQQVRVIQTEGFAGFGPFGRPPGMGPDRFPGGKGPPAGTGAVRNPNGNPREPGPPGPPGPPGWNPESAARVTERIVSEVLTAEQRTAWAELIGKPFTPPHR